MIQADKSAVGAINRPLQLFHPPAELSGLDFACLLEYHSV